ncbi:hypothetical protein AX15_004087 [Amanita polypyramis BW_CC]|nr:hypothetical protein AX15_004087 [Amanita polypyramis BW_CC]
MASQSRAQEQEKKTPPRRWHIANRSPSSATSTGDSPEGDSCSYTTDGPNMTLTTPPPGLIPTTPSSGGGDGELFDSHNIRFVVARERSMGRLWRDPKLSPVGGSIIPRVRM